MTAAFKKKGRKIFTINVPTKEGKWIPRSTKTRDSLTAKAMQRMVDDLGPEGQRAWDLLARVTEPGDAHVPLPELYDLYQESARDISLVRSQLADVDIEPYVKKWLEAIKGGVVQDTSDHYEHYVRTLIPEGKPFMRSAYTSERLQESIDGMDAAPGTKRKAAAGHGSFAVFLVRRKVIKASPMRDVALPKAGSPRVHYLDTPDAIKLAEEQSGQYRAFSALLAGSGIDLSVALRLTRRDVDTKNKEIRAAGTKTYNRDRIVRVADWAWDYIEPVLSGKLPDARLFDEIVANRWNPANAHRKAVERLVTRGFALFKGYTLRDHRHTYAVRAVRAGVPPEVVAKQLGHANSALVSKVYGRFQPSQGERDRWEKIATAADAERAKESKS